jgi:hypothetical protein
LLPTNLKESVLTTFPEESENLNNKYLLNAGLLIEKDINALSPKVFIESKITDGIEYLDSKGPKSELLPYGCGRQLPVKSVFGTAKFFTPTPNAKLLFNKLKLPILVSTKSGFPEILPSDPIVSQ